MKMSLSWPPIEGGCEESVQTDGTAWAKVQKHEGTSSVQEPANTSEGRKGRLYVGK